MTQGYPRRSCPVYPPGWARASLRFLFDEPTIFGVPSLQPSFTQDPNDPANSFTVLTVEIGALADPEHSGLSDSLKNKLAPLFTTLNFFYAVYRAMPADQRAYNAIAMALAIEAAAGPQWQAVLGDDSLADQVTNVLDMNDFTEPFRRLSGFLAMVEGMLRPLTGPADAEQQIAADHARGRILLTQLEIHLNCNKNYYIQQYLQYLAANTRNQAIVDVVDSVIAAAAAVSPAAAGLRARLDVERAFIDRQQIIIPAADAAADTTIVSLEPGAEPIEWTPPPPQRQQVEVPSDGIHMEVAAGACVLTSLPPADTVIDVGVKDASLHLEQR